MSASSAMSASRARLVSGSFLSSLFVSSSVATFLLACAGGPPPQKFEDLPSAEDLYKKGETQLADEEKGFHWFLTPDLSKPIETFQDIIDNYPYSEQAVLAQL